MIQKIRIEEFLQQAKDHPVLDVRSPAEYAHAHIPGAYSLPLFNDEERKKVGTTYKQRSRELAIKEGLDFFGGKMRQMVETTEGIVAQHKRISTDGKQIVLVHCWRGGMRSAGVAWLLDLYGFSVYTLDGGYKSFRRWSLEQLSNDYPLKIIGGYTGSGKTRVLEALKKEGETIVDLEGIANHKGSAFGGFEGQQPSQEAFENMLAVALHQAMLLNPKAIWMEDESQRIGNINVPHALWQTMRAAPLFFLDIDFERRLEHITEEYGKYSRELLVNATIRIQKRLGGQNAKDAIGCLLENDVKGAFRILLAYYDKYYERSLNRRPSGNTQKTDIKHDTIAPAELVKLLLAAAATL